MICRRQVLCAKVCNTTNGGDCLPLHKPATLPLPTRCLTFVTEINKSCRRFESPCHTIPNVLVPLWLEISGCIKSACGWAHHYQGVQDVQRRQQLVVLGLKLLAAPDELLQLRLQASTVESLSAQSQFQAWMPDRQLSTQIPALKHFLTWVSVWTCAECGI